MNADYCRCPEPKDWQNSNVCQNCNGNIVRSDGPTPNPVSGDVGADVAAVLAEPCYVTRSETVRCSGFVGGTFDNGAVWTEEMCCYPCRVLAALAPLIAARVKAAKAEALAPIRERMDRLATDQRAAMECAGTFESHMVGAINLYSDAFDDIAAAFDPEEKT